MSNIYLIQKDTLDNIAAQSMSIAGKTEAVTTNDIISDLTEANTEIGLQSDLISEISAALDGKAGVSELATIQIGYGYNSISTGAAYYTKNGILVTETIDMTASNKFVNGWYTFEADKRTVVYIKDLDLESGGLPSQNVTGGTLLSESVRELVFTVEADTVTVSA